MMTLPVYQYRRSLDQTWKALENGKLTVGFIGGSITDGRPRNNWPEPVVAWFAETFPHARIHVENAAIGATGSELAVFRTERDLIDRGCDLVFVDYAVNDLYAAPERRMNTREGLLRKLLADARRDVVFVYTFHIDMYEKMVIGGMPDSIAEFEQLAVHYKAGSVWMGLHALKEIAAGRMRWEEWLPDGLHPGNRGSLSYAQSVIAYLETDRKRSASAGRQAERTMPEPLSARHWGATAFVPFENVRTEGPWVVRRWLDYEWIDRVLETAAVGAKLAFDFEGRGVALGFDFGQSSAEFRYRLDGGEWVASNRKRETWLPMDGLFSNYLISDELENGKHTLELEVVHGRAPDCKGTNCRIGYIGILRS